MAEKKEEKAPAKQEADKASKEHPAPAPEQDSGCDCEEAMQEFYELLKACKTLIEKDKKKRGIQQGNPHVAEFEQFFQLFLKNHERK